MNKLSFAFLIVGVLLSGLSLGQTKEYKEGIILWMTFDLEKGQPSETSEKYADIDKIVKTKNSYEIYARDKKGLFKIVFKKIEGYNTEAYDYIEVDSGSKYVIKDLLDSKVKALDAINTKDLPDMPKNHKMMLRLLMK